MPTIEISSVMGGLQEEERQVGFASTKCTRGNKDQISVCDVYFLRQKQLFFFCSFSAVLMLLLEAPAVMISLSLLSGHFLSNQLRIIYIKDHSNLLLLFFFSPPPSLKGRLKVNQEATVALSGQLLKPRWSSVQEVFAGSH